MTVSPVPWRCTTGSPTAWANGQRRRDRQAGAVRAVGAAAGDRDGLLRRAGADRDRLALEDDVGRRRRRLVAPAAAAAATVVQVLGVPLAVIVTRSALAAGPTTTESPTP